MIGKECNQSLIYLLIVLEQCEDGMPIVVGNNTLKIDTPNGLVVLQTVTYILQLKNVQE